MCECGCGEQPYRDANQIAGSKVTLAIQVFPGCDSCDYGPGVAVSVFDSPEVEWLEGLKVETITPDEYGANRGHGISVGLFDTRDLVAASEELIAEGYQVGLGDDEYELPDWLAEFGGRLVQDAIRRYGERMRKRAAGRAR